MSKLYKILTEHKDELVMVDDGTNKEVKLGSVWLKEKPYSDKWLIIYHEPHEEHYYIAIG